MKTTLKEKIKKGRSLGLLLSLLSWQLFAFGAERPSTMICPDDTNTSVIELNGQTNFCLGNSATYVATFTGATSPFVAFYWDSNEDLLPGLFERLSEGIVQNGNQFTIIVPINASRQTGGLIAIFSDADCSDTWQVNVDPPTIVNCGISIEDPCVCLNNSSLNGLGQFSETIVVTGLSGQTWEVIAVSGLYSPGVGVPANNSALVPLGTILNGDPMDPQRYLLQGVHEDNQGYEVTVSNGIDTLTIGNQCQYPNPVVNLLENYCLNYPPFSLQVTAPNFSGAGQVRINGILRTTFDPQILGVGNHLVQFTFTANPAEPGAIPCQITRFQFVEIFDNYTGNLSCIGQMNIGLSEDGTVVVTPDLVLNGNYGCTSTFDLEIMGHIGNVLTCADANQPKMVIVRDPIRGLACMTSITVEDKRPPVLICPDVTISCTEDLFSIPADAYIEASDNCGITSLIVTHQDPIFNPTCNPSFSASMRRILRATDAMGNITTCQQTIFLDRPTVHDVVAPKAYEVEGCGATANIHPSVTGYPTIEGNNVGFYCELHVFYSDMNFTVCAGSRLVKRMWQIIDNCRGENRSFVQDIFIRDATAPVLECPADITLSTEPGTCVATYILPAPVSLMDACVSNDLISLAIFVNGVRHQVGDEVTLVSGANTIIYRANDPCINYSNCIQTITVVDTEAPILVCEGITVSLNEFGESIVAISNLTGNQYFDNCAIADTAIAKMSDPVLFGSSVIYTCDEIGINQLLVRVTDAAGNANTCMMVVEVQDLLPPVVVFCPADITLECGIDLIPPVIDAEFADNCLGELNVAFNEEFTSGCCATGVIERTWTAVDQNGGMAVCTQILTIEDTTPPSITCVSDVTVYLDESGTSTLTVEDQIIEISDNCCMTDDIEVVFTPPTLTCSNLNNPIDIDILVRDACGNESMCTVTITVLDTIAPVFVNCLSNVEFLVSDQGVCAINDLDLLLITPEAQDNCTNPLSVSRSFTELESYCTGTLGVAIRRYVFSTVDGSGNIAECQTDLRLIDDVNPIIECPTSTIEVSLDADGNGIISASDIVVSISDECDSDPSLVDANFSFTCNDLGAQTVELQAVDCAGNMGSCIAQIAVIDRVPPIIECVQEIEIILNASGQGILPVAESLVISAQDNCSSSFVYIPSRTNFSCADIGLNPTINIAVVDGSLNMSSCMVTVMVVDITPPVIANCTDRNLLLSDLTDCGINSLNDPAFFGLTANDACDGPRPLTLGQLIVEEDYCEGNIGNLQAMVTFESTDLSNNIATCTMSILIENDLEPTIECVTSTIVNLDSDGQGLIDLDDIVIAVSYPVDCTLLNDNLSITPDRLLAFTCEDIGSTNVVLTVTGCGDVTNSCTVEVIVNDLVPPSISCPISINLILDEAGEATISLSDINPVIGDNCTSLFTPSLSQSLFTCADGLSGSVIVMVTDGSTNANSCTVIVNLIDNTPPVFTNCTDRTYSLSDLGSCDISGFGDAAFFGLTANDACDGIISIDDGNIDNLINYCEEALTPSILSGTTIFSVVDGSSNVAVCSINWTIENDVPPVLECQEKIDVFLDFETGETGVLPSDLIIALDYPFDGCLSESIDLAITGQQNFDCSDVGMIFSVTLTAQGCAGPSASCVVEIEVFDLGAPIVFCPLDATIDCEEDINEAVSSFSFMFEYLGTCVNSEQLNTTFNLNDCGLGNIVFNYEVGSVYGATDQCEVVLTVEQSVAAIFTEDMITWPADFVSQCPVNLPEPISPQFTGGPEYPTEGCTDIRDAFVDEIIAANDNECQIRERTWTLTDECSGISFSYVQRITISLGGTQVISGPTSVSRNNDPGMCGAQIDLAPLVVTDCSGDVLIINSFNDNGADASGFYPIGTTEVTFTILNGCENDEPNTFTITVQIFDTQSPTLTCGQNQTITCSDDLQAAIDAIGFIVTDNCINLVRDTSLQFNLNGCGIGNVRVTFAATDGFNSVSCSRFIFVNADPDYNLTLSDFNLPPSDLTIDCNGDASPASTGAVTLIQESLCGSIVIVAQDQLLLGTPQPSCNTIVRTWTMLDICSGQELEFVQQIVQSAAQPIILSGPVNIAIPNDPSMCSAQVVLDGIEVASCAGDITITNSFNSDVTGSGTYPVGTTLVTYTATNSCGNNAVWEVFITVIDTESPQVICPASVTVACTDDFDAFVNGLAFTNTENCEVNTTSISFEPFTLSCGQGSTVVTYTVTDMAGNIGECTTPVNIQGVFLQESQVTWPADYTLACGEDRDDLTITGSPQFDDFCGAPVASYTDGMETIAIDGCTQFERNWTVSDVCSASEFNYVQLIRVPNYDAISNLSDNTIIELEIADNDACGASIVLNFPIPNFCASDVTLTNDFNIGGSDASGFYPVGTTIVTYSISNSCETLFEMMAVVTVLDLTAPVVFCEFQSQPQSCNTDLLDYINNNWSITVTEACPTTTDIFLDFNVNTCGVGTVIFEYVVTDESDNTGACTRTITLVSDTQQFDETVDVVWPISPLISSDCDADISVVSMDSAPVILGTFTCLQPSISFDDQEVVPADPAYCRQVNRTWTIMSACDGTVLSTFVQVILFEEGGRPFIVEGFIRTISEDGMDNIEVMGVQGTRSSVYAVSGTDGSYRLHAIRSQEGITVEPRNLDPTIQGITTLDILKISRHIRGEERLPTPYHIIAADVDRDNRLSARDLTLLRDLILNKIPSLPHGNWRFVDRNYEFQNPLRPLRENFRETIHLDGSSQTVAHADFVGIRVGDAFGQLNQMETRQNERAWVRVEDQVFSGGEIIEVPFQLADFEQIGGFQLALKFDISKIRLLDIHLDDAISQEHINLDHADLGLILISWDHMSRGILSQSALMTLYFETMQSANLSRALALQEQIIKPELYMMENYHIRHLGLQFVPEGIKESAFELYQNRPNPFGQFTKILFSIPDADQVMLTVFDMQGKVVQHQESYFNAGVHSFTINNGVAGLPDGTYFYRVQTSKYSATKKMILSSSGR
jgi:hypothetical protein